MLAAATPSGQPAGLMMMPPNGGAGGMPAMAGGPGGMVAPPGAEQLERPKPPDLSHLEAVTVPFPNEDAQTTLAIVLDGAPPGSKPMGACLASTGALVALMAKFGHPSFPVFLGGVLKRLTEMEDLGAEVELRGLHLRELDGKRAFFPDDDKRSVHSIMCWYIGDAKLEDTFVDTKLYLWETGAAAADGEKKRRRQRVLFDDFADLVVRSCLPPDILQKADEAEAQEAEKNEEAKKKLEEKKRRLAEVQALIDLGQEQSVFARLAGELAPVLDELRKKMEEADKLDAEAAEARKKEKEEAATAATTETAAAENVSPPAVTTAAAHEQ